MSAAVSHLVCDCDGVLLDSEAAAQRALQTQLAARLPSGVDAAAVIQPRLGMTLEALLADIARQHPLPLTPDEIARIRRAVDAEVAARLRAVPGVAAALRAIPLPKAVASNSAGARVRAALRRTGLWPLFQGRVHCADEVGAAKPAPDVYLAACRSLRAAPDRCLALEDSVTGVAAARAAGLRVLGFAGAGHIAAGHAERLLAAGAGLVFDDMRRLPELVRRLQARPF